MYNCEKEQTSKKKIPLNMNTKNIEEKKTVTHITNHIFINYWVTIYSVQK